MTVAPARQLNVLVVEDEPLIAMVVEFAIEAMGHVMIGPVGRLDEALRIAAGDGFDCAVLDVNIRGGASYPVADLLLAKACPFLLATGYGEWTLPVNLRDRPHLIKPYSGQQLEGELRRLFDQVLEGVGTA